MFDNSITPVDTKKLFYSRVWNIFEATFGFMEMSQRSKLNVPQCWFLLSESNLLLFITHLVVSQML